MEKTKVYILDLRAMDGDIELKIVDKEVWDWVNNPETGQGNLPDDNDACWIDQLAPQQVQDYQKEECGDDDYEGITVSSGSMENDRALLAGPIKIDGKRLGVCFDRKELRDACQRYNLEIIDEYNGFIY